MQLFPESGQLRLASTSCTWLRSAATGSVLRILRVHHESRNSCLAQENVLRFRSHVSCHIKVPHVRIESKKQEMLGRAKSDASNVESKTSFIGIPIRKHAFLVERGEATSFDMLTLNTNIDAVLLRLWNFSNSQIVC